ncbi:MAG: flippase [Chloroflexi bacterium]|nr:flippase [Chloroflexota bacterium]
MNKTGSTVAKNAGVLMASQMLTWVLSLATMIFLPRYLGATGIGQLYLATSIWAIVSIGVAFGMDTLITKEVARQPARLAALFNTSLIVRAILYIVGLGAVFLYVRLAGYADDTVAIIFVIGFANGIRQLSFASRASLQGLERMAFITIGDIVGKAFNTIFSIVLLVLGFKVLVIAAVIIGANFVQAAIQFYYLRRLQPFSLNLDFSLLGWMVKAAFPYLMVAVFLVIYVQLDVVIISLLVNETVVGWYSVADQLFGTLLFVPTVFITAVFPVLSRMYTNDTDALPRLMRKSYDLLLLIGIPIGLGIAVIANPLVVLLFGADFANSGPVLTVMGIVLILTYQNTLLGKFLISVDRQNAWTKVMAVAMLATIPLDFILVPWCQSQFGNGAIGGALAFIVTETGMVIAGFRLLPFGSLGWENAERAMRALLAGMVMAGIVWLVRDWFLAVPVVVGTAVYLTMIWLLRVVPAEDLVLLKTAVRRMAARFRRCRSGPVGL